MTGESIKSRIESELRTAMTRLGGDPLQPLNYAAFILAGASPELLAVVGSIGETLSEEDVLRYLVGINTGKPVIVQGLASGPE